MDKTRFTSVNVRKMLDAITSPRHKHENAATRYLLNALKTGGDIGHGTRYIGMGGRTDVQYGPQGARKAAAYIWGIGCELGAWERLEELAETNLYPYARKELEKSRELAGEAATDLGVMEFGYWERMGREYAQRMNR